MGLFFYILFTSKVEFNSSWYFAFGCMFDHIGINWSFNLCVTAFLSIYHLHSLIVAIYLKGHTSIHVFWILCEHLNQVYRNLYSTFTVLLSQPDNSLAHSTCIIQSNINWETTCGYWTFQLKNFGSRQIY